MDLIWKSHNPVGSPRSPQYKSAIWFENDDQLDVIQETVEPLVVRFERELTTEILPLQTFYNAEDYHQKYVLQRHSEVMKSFGEIYPDFKGFVDSAAAARLNGFAAGHGSEAQFLEEKESYGETLNLEGLRF